MTEGGVSGSDNKEKRLPRNVLLALKGTNRAEGVRRLLEQEGITVDLAAHRSGLVELAWRERYAAIIVDSDLDRWPYGDSKEELSGLPGNPAIHVLPGETTSARGDSSEDQDFQNLGRRILLSLLKGEPASPNTDWSGSHDSYPTQGS